VVRFLREPANAAKYRIDPRWLVVIGHSFGGFLAAYEGSHDADVSAVALISAVNMGKVGADPKERETRLKRWETQLHPGARNDCLRTLSRGGIARERLGLPAMG